jgi:hypothetical protein
VSRRLEVVRSEVWLARVCAVLVGVAFTWLCAALGLQALSLHATPAPRLTFAKRRVSAVAHATTHYWLDHDKCPSKRSDLVANGYLDARNLEDPWGKAIEFSCSDDTAVARSAGPDRAFGTWDDITTES